MGDHKIIAIHTHTLVPNSQPTVSTILTPTVTLTIPNGYSFHAQDQ